jgi:hypothetical protein
MTTTIFITNHFSRVPRSIAEHEQFRSLSAAKLRISERNTKEKLVFLFIPEREELRQGQSYE